jgi:hypothetical protein
MSNSTGMLYVIYHKMFIEHPNSTDNPQGYWAHCSFGLTNSITLLFFCLLGIIHGILPCVFKFSTSSAIIRSFSALVEAQRHKEEMTKYISKDVLEELSKQTQRR